MSITRELLGFYQSTNSVRKIIDYFAERKRNSRGNETKAKNLASDISDISFAEIREAFNIFQGIGLGVVKNTSSPGDMKFMWKDNFNIREKSEELKASIDMTEKASPSHPILKTVHAKGSSIVNSNQSSLSISNPERFMLFLKFIESHLPEDKYQKVVEYAKLLS